MTLVLASVQNGVISLSADTLITFDARLGREPYHALKILSLSPSTIIAFSGHHESAVEIFFALVASRAAELQIRELVNLVARLREQAALSASLGDDVPDFLIAQTAPYICLYRINEHGITECDRDGWIGNQVAAAFVSKRVNEGAEFDGIFQHLVDDNLFNDVGGHIVRVRGNSTGFRFIPHMRLISPKYIPTEGWNTVDFGDARSGGYGYTTITARNIHHNGYGVFFFQGAFGLFFHVDPVRKVCETLKAYAATAESFMSILEEELGFPLQNCGSLG